MTMQRFITVPTAGAAIGLGAKASYRAAARGAIPAVRIGRRKLVVSVEWLDQLNVKAAAETAERRKAAQEERILNR
jgi:hypothetical protein